MHSLQNHLLVAMPRLDQTFFEKSVVYITGHEQEGAFGFMIQRPMQLKINGLLEKMSLCNPQAQTLEQAVLLGGPMMLERGVIIHTATAIDWQTSKSIAPDVVVTTSHDLLCQLGGAQTPTDYMIALGYAGWEPSQLETEIANNLWLTLPATHDLLFHTPHAQRWHAAMRAIGFSINQLSNEIGHA